MGPIQDLRIGIGLSEHDGEGAAQRHPQIKIDVGGMAREDSDRFFHVVDVHSTPQASPVHDRGSHAVATSTLVREDFGRHARGDLAYQGRSFSGFFCGS